MLNTTDWLGAEVAWQRDVAFVQSHRVKSARSTLLVGANTSWSEKNHRGQYSESFYKKSQEWVDAMELDGWPKMQIEYAKGIYKKNDKEKNAKKKFKTNMQRRTILKNCFDWVESTLVATRM